MQMQGNPAQKGTAQNKLTRHRHPPNAPHPKGEKKAEEEEVIRINQPLMERPRAPLQRPPAARVVTALEDTGLDKHYGDIPGPGMKSMTARSS